MFTWGNYTSFYNREEVQQCLHISAYNPDYAMTRWIVDKIQQMRLLGKLQ
jgi:hypothetical protein